jgi:hypothetical protein
MYERRPRLPLTIVGALAGSTFSAVVVMVLYCAAELVQRLVLGHW